MKRVFIFGLNLISLVVCYSQTSNDFNEIRQEILNSYSQEVITRDAKEDRRKISKTIREFRSERAQRVHWIKPILENASDRRITRFRYIENSGREREEFWDPSILYA